MKYLLQDIISMKKNLVPSNSKNHRQRIFILIPQNNEFFLSGMHPMNRRVQRTLDHRQRYILNGKNNNIWLLSMQIQVNSPNHKDY